MSTKLWVCLALTVLGCRDTTSSSTSSNAAATVGSDDLGPVAPSAQAGYLNEIPDDTTASGSALNDPWADEPAFGLAGPANQKRPGGGDFFKTYPGNNGKPQTHPTRAGWQQKQVGNNLWQTIGPKGETYNWQMDAKTGKFTQRSASEFSALSADHWPANPNVHAKNTEYVEPGTAPFKEALKTYIKDSVAKGESLDVKTMNDVYGTEAVKNAATELRNDPSAQTRLGTDFMARLEKTGVLNNSKFDTPPASEAKVKDPKVNPETTVKAEPKAPLETPPTPSKEMGTVEVKTPESPTPESEQEKLIHAEEHGR